MLTTERKLRLAQKSLQWNRKSGATTVARTLRGERRGPAASATGPRHRSDENASSIVVVPDNIYYRAHRTAFILRKKV